MQTHDFTHEYVPAKVDNALTLLLLHGTGGDERSLLTLGAQVAPGAGMLSPRGKVMEGPNPRFFRRKAEGVFDMEDLIFRTHELADWLEAAAAEYGIAPESIVALGYSNGANIAASVMLLHPTTLHKAVLLRPMVPLIPDPAPDLTGAQVLIEAGIGDPLIPLKEAERLGQLLESYGAAVTFQKQPTDHRLTQADLDTARTWLQTVSTEAR